jgi:hypothetical protein
MDIGRNPAWDQVLEQGRDTGGTNPFITDGDAVEFESGAFYGTLRTDTLSANRIWDMPDADGVFFIGSFDASVLNPGAPQDGQVLAWNDTLGYWELIAAGGGGGGGFSQPTQEQLPTLLQGQN